MRLCDACGKPENQTQGPLHTYPSWPHEPAPIRMHKTCAPKHWNDNQDKHDAFMRRVRQKAGP